MTLESILFLDFDGVTHPEPCFQDNVFCRLHLIEAVLREREFRHIDIVISSSWRNVHTFKSMNERFSPDFHIRVIDVTTSTSKAVDDRPDFPRQWQIEAWMMQHRPSGAPWLALDDRPDWFEPDCKNLLVIDGKHGFQAADAERLRDMLWDRL